MFCVYLILICDLLKSLVSVISCILSFDTFRFIHYDRKSYLKTPQIVHIIIIVD